MMRTNRGLEAYRLGLGVVTEETADQERGQERPGGVHGGPVAMYMRESAS
eukprot:CAMPEP_0197463120 /NCGR_PEP_ID=MMETSP1175-20131217/60971_1 /TAXON_ID=1003142 /ORGANISM="Triceratium dubium, Strain CCMP147" /LENGTH=49 /DNA_ID= /DNA_START= /DNA_END= /DNA_ORIENTATION=